MKKALLAAALVACAVAWVAADGFGPPNFIYAPASIGMVLPDDTEEAEDEDGSMNYVSESAGLYVKIMEHEKAFKNADLLNDKKFKAALEELGAKDVEPYSSSPEGDLVFNSAAVDFVWDDGSEDKGFMLLVNSFSAKGKTFIVGIFGPSNEQDYENPVFVACDTIGFAGVPESY